MTKDERTLSDIKRLGIDAELKNDSSFQLHLDQATVMFYTSRKRGNFIYIPWSKQRIFVKSLSKDLLKAVEKVKSKEVFKKELCPFCGDTGRVTGDNGKPVPCKTLNICLMKKD